MHFLSITRRYALPSPGQILSWSKSIWCCRVHYGYTHLRCLIVSELILDCGWVIKIAAGFYLMVAVFQRWENVALSILWEPRWGISAWKRLEESHIGWRHWDGGSQCCIFRSLKCVTIFPIFGAFSHKVPMPGVTWFCENLSFLLSLGLAPKVAKEFGNASSRRVQKQVAS